MMNFTRINGKNYIHIDEVAKLLGLKKPSIYNAMARRKKQLMDHIYKQEVNGRNAIYFDLVGIEVIMGYSRLIEEDVVLRVSKLIKEAKEQELFDKLVKENKPVEEISSVNDKNDLVITIEKSLNKLILEFRDIEEENKKLKEELKKYDEMKKQLDNFVGMFKGGL